MSVPSFEPIGLAPIPIDELASHVRFYIDMIYSSNVAIIPVNYEDFKPLLRICQRMQSEEIQGTLWNGFSKTLSNSKASNLPCTILWEIFGMASREDDNMACSEIITAFSGKYIVPVGYILSRSPAVCEGIALPYLVTLLQGNFHHTHRHNGDNGYKEVGWSDIAQRFARMKKVPHPDGDLDWSAYDSR
jgi:hypothetical protein